MDDIADIWDETPPNDVTSYTDTDLTFSRNWSSRLYDPTGEYRNKGLGIQDQWDLPDLSASLDFASRIGLAKLIDDAEAYISRDEYDVAYTIPPRGWVNREIRRTAEYDSVNQSEEYIQVSMPPVCKEMIEDVIEQGLFESKKEFIQYGIDILVGEK